MWMLNSLLLLLVFWNACKCLGDILYNHQYTESESVIIVTYRWSHDHEINTTWISMKLYTDICASKVMLKKVSWMSTNGSLLYPLLIPCDVVLWASTWLLDVPSVLRKRQETALFGPCFYHQTNVCVCVCVCVYLCFVCGFVRGQ